MLEPKTIEAEIATLNNLLDGLRDQKIRLLICMTIDALKWALEGSETEPPSKVLSLVKTARSYPLSADPHYIPHNV